jgi:hypothetical protein
MVLELEPCRLPACFVVQWLQHSMEQEPRIFKPLYPPSVRLALVLLPVLFITLLVRAGITRTALPVFFWALAISLGLITSLVPFFLIREIRFLDELVVRRHFLPDAFIAFKDIESIDSVIMLNKGRDIRLGKLRNQDELKTQFQRWRAAKLLKGEQAQPDSLKSLYPQRGYGSYATFWGLVFGVMLTIMAPPWLAIDPRWLLAGSFLLIYSIYIYIIPKIL